VPIVKAGTVPCIEIQNISVTVHKTSIHFSVTVHKISIRQGGFVSLHGKSKAAARSADQFADDWDRHQVTVGTAARLVNASAARTLSP
jgi:hypothetical protein